MGSLLAQVVPLAAGAALSPGLLALQMLNLSRPGDGARRAWAVAAGAAAVVATVSVGALFVTIGLGDLGRDEQLRAGVRLVAAVVLVGVAAFEWLHPPKAGHASRPAGGSPLVMAGLGAGLIAPNMAIYLPAAHEIARSGVGATGKVAAFLVAGAIALLPVLAPPLAVAALGERARPPLEALNRLVTENSRRVTIVACLGFAVYLAITGARGLGG